MRLYYYINLIFVIATKTFSERKNARTALIHITYNSLEREREEHLMNKNNSNNELRRIHELKFNY